MFKKRNLSGFSRDFTKTKKGLQVFARLLDKQYKLGISVSEKEKCYLNLTNHEPILDLNYSIAPQKDEKEILKIAKKYKVKAQVIGSVIKEKGVYLDNGTRLDYQL